MKRIVISVALAAVFMAVASIIYISNSPTSPLGRVDAPKIMAAAQAYAQELKANGTAVPTSVSLQTLIARGLLHPGDVSGFDGMEVSVTLGADQTRPQDVLMRARLPGGHEILAMGDGSVQQARR